MLKPGSLDITDVAVDKPLRDEVLVRTLGSGLCHSDLHVIDGDYGAAGLDAPGGMLFGHEASGLVEAVGEDVTYVRPGDHVVTFPLQYCGHCEYCLRGRPTLCTDSPGARSASAPPRLTRQGRPVFQFNNLGGFAEQMLVHEHALVKIDPEYPMDRAAIIGCGVATGFGGVVNTAAVRAGSAVAVIGLGGVGLAAVQTASLVGAGQIIAVDTEPAKLDLALELGASHRVDASSADPVGEVLELSGGGVDYSFEAIGLRTTVEQSVRMLRRAGIATVLGIAVGQRIELDGGLFVHERRLQGSLMGSCRPRTDLPRIVELDLAGRLDLRRFIDRRIALEEINDGYDAMRRRRIAGRRVITFSQ
ncbi:Zn-dependent alcohol dehydrogenase [Actinomadura rugatobispora]|uniref:Zn-dependent alcohol dehydrogenase n=1 Tax=Actinomadura rugatobispora TaxID=1994 RepID=A0ABW0ZW47_9ACTN|nr:Zn-dependent alcohol dehydrogenase [Actinomadura rugatobispora]